jgi:cytochrome b561
MPDVVATPGLHAAYSRPARVMHWVTAGLLVVLFGLGLSMTSWIEEDMKLRVYSWHEWVGLTVFAITATRLLWRLRHPPPPFELPRAERVVSGLVHGAIYAVLLVQPIVGWLMSTAFGFPVVYLGIIPLPQVVPADRALAERLQYVHFTLAMTLLALFAAHMCGVLYHHLVRQDGLLQRMLPGRSV